MPPSLKDLNKFEFKASIRDASLTLTSEYGEAGHGSAPPWELMWKNPLPAQDSLRRSFHLLEMIEISCQNISGTSD